MHRFVETLVIGLFALLKQAIALVPLGATLALAGVVLLFQNEGRPDFAAEARNARPASVSDGDLADGAFVSVTGPIAASAPVGNPAFLAPGPYISVSRHVETFAWNEQVSSRRTHRWGGSMEVETTYEYVHGWTPAPQPPEAFRYPEGHENPAPEWSATSFADPDPTIGGVAYDPIYALPLITELLDPAELRLIGRGADATIDEGWLYPAGRVETPQLGDQRVRFTAIRAGATVTAFGDAHEGMLRGHAWTEQMEWVPLFPGERAEAVNFLQVEYRIRGWIVRVIGFGLMWAGLFLILSPLVCLAYIVPPIGTVVTIVSVAGTGIVALGVTIVVSTVAYVLHSPLLIFLSLVVLYAVGRSWWDARRAERDRERIMRMHKSGQSGAVPPPA